MTTTTAVTIQLPRSKGSTVARLSPGGILAGTPVMTADGDRPAEDLRPGDRVLTRDYGAQVIKAIAVRDVTLDDAPDRAPVLVPAHALGAQFPTCPVYLGADQRVALSHRLFDMFFGHREVLINANHLPGVRGITQVQGLSAVTQISLAFARHQLLYCSNLAVDLGPFAGPTTRPTLSRSDTRIALGVLSGGAQPAATPQRNLH